MKPYDQGYQDAIRHIYKAVGLALTEPLDEDHAIERLKILRRASDDAHAAYEAETQSTMEMAAKITQLEGCLRTEGTRIENLKADRDQWKRNYLRSASQCDQWKRTAMEDQRRWADASSALRGAIARLETIRETHGHEIALDRDIEIYRAGLQDFNSQNKQL